MRWLCRFRVSIEVGGIVVVCGRVRWVYRITRTVHSAGTVQYNTVLYCAGTVSQASFYSTLP
jgi:hypothetical protein